MHKPLERATFHSQSFCPGMDAMNLQRAFCPWFLRLFPKCSHNQGVCRPPGFTARLSAPPPKSSFACAYNTASYGRGLVVASGFGMLFYRVPDIPIRFRLVFSPPSSNFFYCTLYTIPFNCSLHWFHENMTQYFQWFKSCHNVLTAQNPSRFAPTPL